MTAKNANEKSKKPSREAELKSGELDKVTGGLKVGGPTAPPKPKTVVGDPCEGGQ
jgi:hypothetical protein